MTHGGTNTIITSITTTDDDDVFALGTDIAAVLQLGIEKCLCIELNTRQLGIFLSGCIHVELT